MAELGVKPQALAPVPAGSLAAEAEGRAGVCANSDPPHFVLLSQRCVLELFLVLR